LLDGFIVPFALLISVFSSIWACNLFLLPLTEMVTNFFHVTCHCGLLEMSAQRKKSSGLLTDQILFRLDGNIFFVLIVNCSSASKSVVAAAAAAVVVVVVVVVVVMVVVVVVVVTLLFSIYVLYFSCLHLNVMSPFFAYRILS
jgi:hypothetical protein